MVRHKILFPGRDCILASFKMLLHTLLFLTFFFLLEMLCLFKSACTWRCTDCQIFPVYSNQFLARRQYSVPGFGELLITKTGRYNIPHLRCSFRTVDCQLSSIKSFSCSFPQPCRSRLFPSLMYVGHWLMLHALHSQFHTSCHHSACVPLTLCFSFVFVFFPPFCLHAKLPVITPSASSGCMVSGLHSGRDDPG